MKFLITIIFAITLFASCSSPDKKTEALTETTAQAEHQHIYACPMHPEVQGHEGDKCPKCGMTLVHMDEAPKAGNFSMALTTVPARMESGKDVTLKLTPFNEDDKSSSVPLDVEHEKKIHLIIVSEDLSFFDHVHPEYTASGSYDLTTRFPHGGSYILYADYRPSGSTHQLDTIRVTVDGKPQSAVSYTKERATYTIDNTTVTLKPDSGVFYSGQNIHFDGIFTKNGKPFDVNLLENYLGAKGHMVAIHTGTHEYVHLHPEVEGTILHFHTRFETPGIYKVWLQFMDEGKLYTSDFVFDVKPGKNDSMNHESGNHTH